MRDIPQPADEPYEVGDSVRIYLAPNDVDTVHHGETRTVVEILQDNLDEKTGRELDSYSYRIEVDNREVSTWFRHGDLTPNQE